MLPGARALNVETILSMLPMKPCALKVQIAHVRVDHLRTNVR
jgi:hypothetical protein